MLKLAIARRRQARFEARGTSMGEMLDRLKLQGFNTARIPARPNVPRG